MKYSPLEQFEIHPIINFSLSPFDFLIPQDFFMFLGWLDFSITNSTFSMLFACYSFLFITRFSLSNSTIIPTFWQSIVENIYEFIYFLIEEQIGTNGYKYFNFIITLFLFILCCNLLGMIPYSFTATSHIVITFGLSIAIFIGVTTIGIVSHGFHFFSLFAPAGVPMWLLPLIIAIELISYMTRSLSLGIRLTANMFAGHTLLKIISTFIWKMIRAKTLFMTLIVGAPILLLIALTGLEVVIAILQAYVFTVLTCSYLNDSINLH